MARRVTTANNTLILDDYIGGGEVHLYYRMPTPAERAAFLNAVVRRKGRKVETRTGQARQEYGLLILTGFREGDFLDESGAPFSAVAEAETYRADWQALVMKAGADLVELLGAFVFEGSASVRTPDDENGDDGDSAEDAEGN
jgi:phosphate-selective porin